MCCNSKMRTIRLFEDYYLSNVECVYVIHGSRWLMIRYLPNSKDLDYESRLNIIVEVMVQTANDLNFLKIKRSRI